MRINELVQEAYEAAKAKGWHETERSPLEFHMLAVSEIAEATEEARAGRPPLWIETPNGCSAVTPEMAGLARFKPKPEGELIELADAVIRIADYCGLRGWDLEKAIRLKLDYNRTREHRHGGKKY